jgi:hypothetical protein
MDQLKLSDHRKVIGKFYSEHHNKGKLFTFNHFKLMKVPKATIYRITNKTDNSITLDRKSKWPSGCENAEKEEDKSVKEGESKSRTNFN